MPNKSNRKIFLITGTVAAIMFAFCFAMVPLYSLICKKTGIDTPSAGGALLSAVSAETKEPADLTRTVTVQFEAAKHKGMPWDFYPRTQSIEVHPGQNNKVYFYIKNTTSHDATVQAIPSMTPTTALQYFHKIECFCFTQQKLKAQESKEMPMIFRIDNELPKDIRVITLAYTLFDTTPKETKKG